MNVIKKCYNNKNKWLREEEYKEKRLKGRKLKKQRKNKRKSKQKKGRNRKLQEEEVKDKVRNEKIEIRIYFLFDKIFKIFKYAYLKIRS